jgi:hypothetical protein
VSTKGYASGNASEPKWLSKIEKLRMLLIPRVAAESAVAGGLNCWITATGEPRVSRSALREIDRLGERFKSLIVVLPDGLNLVARDFSTGQGSPQGILLQTDLPQFADLVPMASVFFPAFIVNDLVHGVSPDPLSLLKQLEQSLVFTREWMTNEFDRIKNAEGWQAKNEPCFKATNPNTECQTLDQKRSEEKTDEAPFFDWKRAKAQWTQAFSDIGVIKIEVSADEVSPDEVSPDEVSKEKKIIEPERAMTEIKNYICCVK